MNSNKLYIGALLVRSPLSDLTQVSVILYFVKYIVNTWIKKRTESTGAESV